MCVFVRLSLSFLCLDNVYIYFKLSTLTASACIVYVYFHTFTHMRYSFKFLCEDNVCLYEFCAA